jgi:hypothetical protein
MVDQCPFFLEVLAQINNNTFLFQQHFKATCDFLPPPTQTRFLPFEQHIEQHMVHFQDLISEHFYHHALFSMSFDGYLKSIVLEFYHVLPLGHMLNL